MISADNTGATWCNEDFDFRNFDLLLSGQTTLEPPGATWTRGRRAWTSSAVSGARVFYCMCACVCISVGVYGVCLDKQR